MVRDPGIPESGGLIGEPKKALAERMLNTEIDMHPQDMGENASRSVFDRRAFLFLTAGTSAMAMASPLLAKAAPDLAGLSLHEVSDLVRTKQVSPVDLTRACLARIDAYDRRINAFITVTRELALAQAAAAEREIMAGQWRGPLHGVPIGLKDNIDTAGIRTTAASAVYVTRVPDKDAEVVRRLKEAGAVTLGKLNLNEFAGSYDGVVSFWGPSHNPWKPDRITGGSSSGSAAAVAADFCYGALGTDTGGSVRIPSALCGIVGLKPTYGLISTGGVIPLSESLDHVGPMCKTVLDTALMLQVLAGYDPEAIGSVKTELPDYAAAVKQTFTPPRLGIPQAYFFDNLDPGVEEVFSNAMTVVRSLASEISGDVVLPDEMSAMIRTVTAEFFAYHKGLIEEKLLLYQPSTRKWIGAMNKGAAIGAADYIIARKRLEEVRRSSRALFQRFDLLVMPTWKEEAMTIEDCNKQLESSQDQQVILYNTVPFNVLGLPAISVPCGFTKAGLPVGLQIVGPPLSDTKVLAFAHAYEQATQWHLRKPRLSA